MKKTRPLAVSLLFGLLLALTGGSALAQGDSKAMVLVAQPTLGAAYAQTVLVVVPAGETGHVGFIINRPLKQTLGAIFPEHAPAQKVIEPVRFGGPVMVDTVFAVVRAPAAPGGESQRLFGDLFLASRAADIDRIIEHSPNDARYFVGFVGWRPGELEAEIARNYWYVIEPQADLLFREDLQGLWRELVNRLGVAPGPGQRAI
jgi:putative transcriptional regulator